MKIAYFDCQFGAAGDMLIGALLDAGLNEADWLAELANVALPADSYKIEIKQVQRRTLAAKKFDVVVSEKAAVEHAHLGSRSSRPAQRHRHRNGHEHDHEHDHEHEHGHGHGHDHDVPAVAMDYVLSIIDNSKISLKAKELARRVIARLGNCESSVHGMSTDAIYFHEVGAIDTIVDIIGFAIAYDMLGINKAYVSAVPVGRGHVQTLSGVFPVPAPAVALMLAQIKAPILDYEIDFECLTPTAVALLAEICQQWGKMPRFDEVHAVGHGAGSKEGIEHPNICRVMVGEVKDPS